ncbi:MAG: hypothetical protein ACOCXG_00640 [Nanoarchaeota archaeon]
MVISNTQAEQIVDLTNIIRRQYLRNLEDAALNFQSSFSLKLNQHRNHMRKRLSFVFETTSSPQVRAVRVLIERFQTLMDEYVGEYGQLRNNAEDNQNLNTFSTGVIAEASSTLKSQYARVVDYAAEIDTQYRHLFIDSSYLSSILENNPISQLQSRIAFYMNNGAQGYDVFQLYRRIPVLEKRLKSA